MSNICPLPVTFPVTFSCSQHFVYSDKGSTKKIGRTLDLVLNKRGGGSGSPNFFVILGDFVF